MIKFLRVIRQGRWHKKPDMDWLGGDEIQGDALNDIRSKGCSLSVYMANSEVAIERIVVALAASREHVSNLDYAVFGGTGLTSLGIVVLHTAGNTPDAVVDSVHYDLRHLTVDRLAREAKIISGGNPERVGKKSIGKMLQEAVRAGILDKTRINNSLRTALWYDMYFWKLNPGGKLGVLT